MNRRSPIAPHALIIRARRGLRAAQPSAAAWIALPATLAAVSLVLVGITACETQKSYPVDRADAAREQESPATTVAPDLWKGTGVGQESLGTDLATLSGGAVLTLRPEALATTGGVTHFGTQQADEARKDAAADGVLPSDFFDFRRSAATPPPSQQPASVTPGGAGAGQSPFRAPGVVNGMADAEELKRLAKQAPDGRLTEAQRGAVIRSRTAKEAAAAAAAKSLRQLVDAPGSLPTLAEEVWVIQRYCPPDDQRPKAADDYPGTGILMTRAPHPDAAGQTIDVPVPLKHTDVNATIAGNIASVDVTQQFTNPYASKIEAVYVFPLPENAAVSEFVMTIGDRRIRGIVRERDEAKQIYETAKSQGRVASLLQQERPNIFTQSVANIEPGKAIDIQITYFNTLQYIDGAFEFAFPMVVGPRFNPPGFYDGVGAVSRGAAARTPGSSGQAVEVPYLKPGERSGHDISISVSIDAGVPIERVWSDSHVVEVGKPLGWCGTGMSEEQLKEMAAQARRTARVTLSPRDAIPNKDFVLRYAVAGDGIRSGVVTHVDKDGTAYFSALVIPPADAMAVPRGPVELVFVLDCSGSMNGRPIEQAVCAVTRGLRRLDPDDTFQIINFANSSSQLGPAPILATEENVRRGIDYVQSLFAQGGTMMVNGLRASLDFPHDPRRLRFVCFLTDGYIGNEAEIIGEIHARLGPSRIFSMGIGSSVNRYLIDAMAKVGRGCVAHVAAGDSPDQIMDRFFDRISRPAMTDLALDLGGLDGAEIFPRTLPDLFVGRAIVINGRLKPGQSLGNTVIRVRGRQAGADAAIEIPVTTSGIVAPATSPALAKIWARHKIADLADTASPAAVAESVSLIRDVALQYGMMSAFTSFVAVDSLSQTAGTTGTTVQVPLPMPEGVRYETNVADR